MIRDIDQNYFRERKSAKWLDKKCLQGQLLRLSNKLIINLIIINIIIYNKLYEVKILK